MGSIGPTTPSKVTTTDVDNLKSLLNGTSAEVRLPSDANYSESIKRWSAAAVKQAGIAILPTDNSQVSKVVKYVADRNIDLAVKGGGHSTAGVSSTDGGVLLDLHNISYVDVDTERKLLRIGGGANWGQVDQAAFKHGLGTVGGTVADTGVGGLALGGGYGWFSGTHGLVIDCLVECTVVLASGDAVKASETENPGLFWALRGAGQNFGVVTEFVVKAFDVPKEVWAGLVLFAPTPENIEKVVEASNKLYMPDENGKTKVNGRAAGGLGFSKPPPAGGQTMFMAVIIFPGPEEEGKELFKEILDVGPAANLMQMVPWPKANELLAPPYGLRASMKGAAFELPMRPEFFQEVLAEYTDFTNKNDDVGVSLLLWELFDTAKVVESDIGSFANRGQHLNGMICPIWTKPENDPACRQWARDLNEMFKKEMAEHAKKDVGPSNEVTTLRGKKNATQFYGNYDHYDEKSRDIFGDNYEELQKLKARYDPENVFNKLFAITPA